MSILSAISTELSYPYILFMNIFHQGGALATPSSPETFHEMMDVAEALQNKDIHEKCFAGSGALVIWTGAGSL